MKLDEFVTAFSAEFEETPKDKFTPTTEYRQLDEWDSLTALSIISIVDEKMEKRITGANLREYNTIEELFNFIITLSND